MLAKFSYSKLKQNFTSNNLKQKMSLQALKI